MITDHHLVPRERGGTVAEVVPLCRPCHGHVHATYDNKTLASDFATIEALRRDPRLQKFVRFIRKQDPAARFSSATTSSRRKRRPRR
jgi:hypothetical protein